MTKSFNVSTTPATGALGVYLMKALWITAGWTVPSSSDGTTYNSSGDQISSGSSGAGGLDNASAWWVTQMPGTTRQLCWQRNSSTGASTSRSWRIKYSKSAGFSGGSPGATRVPSASDEQVLLGGGTDAAPTFQQLFSGTDGSLRFNCMADGSSPYGSYMFLVNQGLGTIGAGGFFVEPMTATVSGDPDPYVIWISGTGGTPAVPAAAGGTAALGAEAGGPMGYINMTWTTGLSAPVYSTGGGTFLPTDAGSDPVTSKDGIFPIMFGRRAAVASPNGYKGFSTILMYPSVTRAALSTLSVASPGALDYVLLNGTAGVGLCLPWNGTIPGT